MGFRKNYRKSLMPTEKGTCYRCGCNKGYERHHCIHGTANRQVAEDERLWVFLCNACHGDVHRIKEIDLDIEKDAQYVWESNYRKEHNASEDEARAAWIGRFGKSYIYD